MSFFLAFSSSLSFCADERLSASPRLSTAMAKNTFKRMTNHSSGKQPLKMFKHCHHYWCLHEYGRSNINIWKDTVSTDIQNDEINADKNSWESWSTMSHNTIVHDGIPLLPSQNLGKKTIFRMWSSIKKKNRKTLKDVERLPFVIMFHNCGTQHYDTLSSQDPYTLLKSIFIGHIIKITFSSLVFHLVHFISFKYFNTLNSFIFILFILFYLIYFIYSVYVYFYVFTSVFVHILLCNYYFVSFHF